jgi:hypothetical protein
LTIEERKKQNVNLNTEKANESIEHKNIDADGLVEDESNDESFNPDEEEEDDKDDKEIWDDEENVRENSENEYNIEGTANLSKEGIAND